MAEQSPERTRAGPAAARSRLSSRRRTDLSLQTQGTDEGALRLLRTSAMDWKVTAAGAWWRRQPGRSDLSHFIGTRTDKVRQLYRYIRACQPLTGSPVASAPGPISAGAGTGRPGEAGVLSLAARRHRDPVRIGEFLGAALRLDGRGDHTNRRDGRAARTGGQAAPVDRGEQSGPLGFGEDLREAARAGDLLIREKLQGHGPREKPWRTARASPSVTPADRRACPSPPPRRRPGGAGRRRRGGRAGVPWPAPPSCKASGPGPGSAGSR
ncbi:MAG: hypothetical protein K0R62_3718 [Nonomuraea muscovyensis]|nr:hypothetical protein [Nonomuraea muscovyensis]